MQFFVHLAALDRLGQRVQDEGVRGIARTLRGGCDARFPRLGTWKDDGGLYVDGVLQGGRHRYTASPVLGPAGGGKGSSLLASVEVGQSFGIAAGWTIEPQLQLVHQRVSLDDTGIVGAQIRQDSHDGWLVRAGVRVKGEFDTRAGLLQPMRAWTSITGAAAPMSRASSVRPASLTSPRARGAAAASWPWAPAGN